MLSTSQCKSKEIPNCTKLDTCPKITMLRDKDMLDFQFAESVRAVCALCEEYEPDALS